MRSNRPRTPIGTMVILCAALGSLSACGEETAPEEQVEEMSSAAGEVLEGSISDAMLPIDELRSRAPQAAIVPEGSGTASSAGNGAASSTSPAPAADPAPSETQAAAPAIEAAPVLDLPPEPDGTAQ